MSRKNKKRFSCGHRGFGAYCHRCEQADKLEEMAKSGKTYVDHKALGRKAHHWTKEEMLAEAKRLRSEGKGR